MLFLQFLPVVLSLLVLAAHFLRAGQVVLVAVPLVMIGLLAVHRRWAARSLQVVLILGALEWIRTLVVLSRIRADHGAPVERMAIILGVVALVTGASALVFRTRRARSHFHIV